MRAEDILRRCADRNIQVEGKNGRLLVNPASALTPDLRMELKRGSRMLLRRLESANASPALAAAFHSLCGKSPSVPLSAGTVQSAP